MKSAHDFEGGIHYEEGKEFTVATNEMPEKVQLGKGTPVIVHGLKRGKRDKAVRLNGRIGDARKYDEETQRYEVHFEDKTLAPSKASVKMANLQILFDLPE